MKITTPKGWILEFKKCSEGWQSEKQLTNRDESSIIENPGFLFEDSLYRGYQESADFEKDLGLFIDFYIDNQEWILSQTKAAVTPITAHNHDFTANDEVDYILFNIEIFYLKRYQFKINFVLLYGYVYYDIFYDVLSPDQFLITKVERLLNY
ncbi:hypothetical protein JET18_02790 [Chryseobacterium sp. L7]|uniref:Uncharacterized protein n=1 Tax=Chryseobacterium endalhagicum TaxID=2797638 RepID=A0ABS1QAW0_9FLAO|nr:hypothetical protein [Chryseobacterium endalhagicum]MBL1219745.1 hypothetical protein [Chryseobacterium endalhagicum]